MATLTFNEDKHEYTLNGRLVPSVTQILETCGLSQFDSVSPDILNAAINYGNAVHRMTELEDLGKLNENDLDQMLWPVLDRYRQWKHDANVIVFPDLVEKRVYSNTRGYAGTLDRIVDLNGRLVLIDIKSGVKSRAHRVQTAAYHQAYQEITKTRQRIQRACLYLNEGQCKLDWHESPQDFPAFQAALQVWKFKNLL